jgi:hypothetical protein
MKPDWKDAPEWANYLAMDEDGEYYWFADVPQQGLASWRSKDDSNVLLAEIEGIGWRNSLEERP